MYTLEEVKENLRTKRYWTEKAIVRLFEEQTEHEKQSAMTAIRNNVGFNATDAAIMTSFAQRLLQGRALSEKQLAIAQRRIPKYAKQLLSLGKEAQNG